MRSFANAQDDKGWRFVREEREGILNIEQGAAK